MWFQRIAAVLLSAGFCIVVILATSWNLRLPQVEGTLALTLADDPERIFRQLGSELVADGGEVSDSYRAQVREAARRDPLSDEAFVLEAVRSRSLGRYREALGRLELARKRDPRNRLTRIMLFEAYLREARARDVVIEAVTLDRLRAGETQTLFPLLASLAQNPSTSQATSQALGGSSLEYPIMRALAERMVSPGLLISFARRPAPEGGLDDGAKQQINGLVEPYLKAGKWVEAAELWMHFYGRAPGELERIIDQDFTGKLGPPFGWQLGRSDGGIAEQGDEGLQVADFGRKRWEVIRQALLMRPGTYRLRYVLNNDTGDLPDLAWRLDCAGSGKNLLELPFESKNFLGMTATDRFDVPADNCSVQWLSLVNRSGAAGETRSVLIRSVEISQAGGQ